MLKSFKCHTGGDEDGIPIAESLKVNRTLQHFHLTGSGFTSETGVALAQALVENPTLETFKFEAGLRGNSHQVALAKALMENTTLKGFDLWCSDDEHCVAVAEALRVNCTLQVLSLSWVGGAFPLDKTAVALAEAVADNSTLKTLHLTGFCDSLSYWAALADTLKTNCSLMTLQLPHFVSWHNENEEDEAQKQFAAALEHNSTLQGLTLYHDGRWPKEHHDITAALKRNHELRRTWAVLLVLRSCVLGFGGLHSRLLQRAVFAFFMPSRCTYYPPADGPQRSSMKLRGNAEAPH